MILKEITMSHVWTTEITKKKEFWFVKKREKSILQNEAKLPIWNYNNYVPQITKT